MLLCEPLVGKRWVDVTKHSTKVDWAEQIKQLVDVLYPEAEKIVLVCDNLNTHTLAELYAEYPRIKLNRLCPSVEQ